jgi:hypothetical protein
MSDPQMHPDPIDEQSTAESLDDDKVRGVDFPADEPVAVEDFGTTPLEESGGESFEQRVAREEPDGDLREPPRPSAGLLDPDDEFGDDETKELVGVAGDEPDQLTAEEAAIHIREPTTDDEEEEPLIDLAERLDASHHGHEGLDGASLKDTQG